MFERRAVSLSRAAAAPAPRPPSITVIGAGLMSRLSGTLNTRPSRSKLLQSSVDQVEMERPDDEAESIEASRFGVLTQVMASFGQA